MASYNRVVLLGNVTRDLDIRYLASGMAVLDLGLAVNDRRKNANGEWVEETTFVDVTLWGRTAEVAGEYLSKGSPVFIEGRLKLDTWEQDGQKRSKLKVVGEKMQLIGGRGGGGGGGGGGGTSRPASQYNRQSQQQYDTADYNQQESSGPPQGDTPDDDIPF